MKNIKNLTLSIVSHKNIDEIFLLLDSLLDIDYACISKIVITINTPENISESIFEKYPFTFKLIKNKSVKGFGENHNHAFNFCETQFFLVINPDIILPKSFNFKNLISELVMPCGLVTGNIITNNKVIYPRKFPKILDYLFLKKKNYLLDQLNDVDWISGCFMLFDRNIFSIVNGFDERFFLYMEDVDICRRIKKNKFVIRVVPDVIIIHNSKNKSYKSLKHLFMHIISIYKYFKGFD